MEFIIGNNPETLKTLHSYLPSGIPLNITTGFMPSLRDEDLVLTAEQAINYLTGTAEKFTYGGASIISIEETPLDMRHAAPGVIYFLQIAHAGHTHSLGIERKSRLIQINNSSLLYIGPEGPIDLPGKSPTTGCTLWYFEKF